MPDWIIPDRAAPIEPVDPEPALREVANASETGKSEMEKANDRLAKAAEAGRAVMRRRKEAIEQLFPKRSVAMSKMEAFAEAQRRLGPSAFVWRLPKGSPATRFVVGVRTESMDKVVLAAAGAGPSWEGALENQLHNERVKLEEGEREMAVIEQVAEVCHEANRAWTKVADGSVPVQPHWDDAPEEMRQASRAGVAWRMSNMDAPASAGHDEWMRAKMADGWTLGPEKDAEKKTHPSLVPYDQLPVEQQQKDFLFAAICMALGRWDAFKAPSRPPEDAPAAADEVTK